MATLETQTGTIRHLELDGELNISSAEELKEKLVRALESGTGIQVSLAGVSALDITAVQLLWAAKRQAGMAGIPFTFAHPLPDWIVTQLREAGISPASFSEGEW